ncbi:MAG TPA: papain-like cysteine protease family protein [Candidatus Dormibacteraeota bacterium]
MNINFTIQHQEQTNWCWAGTSCSVECFYNPASTWTQCKIANSALGRTDCCGAGAGGACNQGWYLDRALGIVNHMNVFSTGSISPDAIDGEMGQGRPVGVRTAWSGGGAHFLALRGRYTLWDQATQSYPNWVSAADPWYGNSEVLYNTFLNSYQGSGTWSHTYTTKP